MQRVLVLAALALVLGGCGGAISSVYIIQGQLALSGARAANAENLAPYEYTSADAYLRKAREAHSYADFEHSLRFARMATQRAQVARKRAMESGKPLELPPGETPPPAAGAPPPQQPPLQQPPPQIVPVQPQQPPPQIVPVQPQQPPPQIVPVQPQQPPPQIVPVQPQQQTQQQPPPPGQGRPPVIIRRVPEQQQPAPTSPSTPQ